ncbi:MAG TPA: DNA repair protein RadA [Clostridia bacterium]|nr:DNA repair protein RadA [Clostridia bacterium]
MKRTSTQFVCKDCGYESLRWMGKCPNCGEWNTFQEFKTPASAHPNRRASVGQAKLKVSEARPIKLSEIKAIKSQRIPSRIGELDRVLGNGFVQGSVVLLAGEPGIGKSTLLLELCKNLALVLYVCGEESVEQVKLRAQRLGLEGKDLLLLPETNVEAIIEKIPQSANKSSSFLIIDSIQTLWSEEIDAYPGSISQVRGCSQKILEYAKKNGITVVLVGHVTKEGAIAGPMILSHMVDTVLFLEGERFADLRLLRGIKNRFGPTDEVGVFRMEEKGMQEVKNPSELFLEEEKTIGKEAGNVNICVMEGTRPMLLEIQALVTQSALAVPRRVVNGVDYNRVLLLTAVIQKSLGIPLYNQDIFVKVAGGFKVSEPAVDLGICLSIISSFKNQPMPLKTCVFGEVGLLGEVRRVGGEEKREKEAKKLGFKQILSPKTVKSLREAAKALK